LVKNEVGLEPNLGRDQDAIERLLAATFAERDSSMIGHDYLVIAYKRSRRAALSW